MSTDILRHHISVQIRARNRGGTRFGSCVLDQSHARSSAEVAGVGDSLGVGVMRNAIMPGNCFCHGFVGDVEPSGDCGVSEDSNGESLFHGATLLEAADGEDSRGLETAR